MKISVDMKKSKKNKKKQAIEMVKIDELHLLKRRAIVYIAY